MYVIWSGFLVFQVIDFLFYIILSLLYIMQILILLQQLNNYQWKQK